MTYAIARRQIVSLLEAVTLTEARLYTDKLKHLAEGRTGIECRSRSFWLEANADGDGGVTGPYTPDLAGQPRMTFPLTLTVSYRVHERRSVMDEVLASDQRDYSIALLTPSNWNRPTSGIHSITRDANYLPTRRAFVGDAIEQRTFLSLWFS